MSGFPIHRGNLIISANNNSRWDFWTNNETQRFVLANPFKDLVPLAVREPNHEQFSYEHVTINDLEIYLASTRHRIVRDYSLPGDDRDKAQNILRLWKVPHLLENTPDNSLKLKEGMFLFLVFNSHGDINEIAIPETVGQVKAIFETLLSNLETNNEEKIPYAMLHVQNGELKVFTQKNMPIEFYDHLKSFNNLIETQEILVPIKELHAPKEVKL